MSGKATINIKFLADLKQFSTQMQNASRDLQKMGKKLKELGTTLSVGVTAPFTAFSALSLKNWDVQEKAIAQVEAGLASVGNTVGYTSGELQKMASDLQANSLFGDEEILQKSTAQLLTFTNIANDEFKRTQKVALDLSTRLDGDLKSATIQLGKALNDPLANLSALSRSGIQFSEDQKATIKTFAETNRLADAQKVILSELEKQYGGSAAAAAKAGTGPFKQLANSIGDLSEEFGKIIADFLLPFVDKIKELVVSFQGLSPKVKEFIVVLGGVASASGPLLLLAGTVLPAIASGFAVLTVPIGLVVAGLTAIGVVIYKNWEPIKKTLVSIANYFIDLYNESTVFRIAIEGVVLQFKNTLSVARFVFSSIRTILDSFVDGFVNRFKLVGAIIKLVLTGELRKLPDVIKEFQEKSRKNFSQLGEGLKSDWSDLMVDVSGDTQKAIANIGKRAKIKVLEENVDVSSIAKAIDKAVPKNNTIPEAPKRRKKATDILSLDTDKQGGLSQGFDLGMVEGVNVEAEQLKTGLQGIQESFVDFSEGMTETVASSTTSFLDGFGEMIGGLVTGSLTISDIGGMILQTVGSFLKKLGQAAIKVGAAAKAIHAAFTNPFAAIAAGVALIAAGSVFSNLGAQQSSDRRVPLDKGGIAYGPTNSLIGEYAGASSNPEVVAPLSKLRELITPVSQVIDIKLSGVLSAEMGRLQVGLNRYEQRKSRTT